MKLTGRQTMLGHSRMLKKKKKKEDEFPSFSWQRQASCASVRLLILAVRHGCLLCFDVRASASPNRILLFNNVPVGFPSCTQRGILVNFVSVTYTHTHGLIPIKLMQYVCL